MASADRYAVQIYNRSNDGQFAIGRSIACKNADEARRRAEQSCSGRQDIGAAAFLLKGDEYLGPTEDPIAIAVFGCCPPEVKDEIPF